MVCWCSVCAASHDFLSVVLYGLNSVLMSYCQVFRQDGLAYSKTEWLYCFYISVCFIVLPKLCPVSAWNVLGLCVHFYFDVVYVVLEA